MEHKGYKVPWIDRNRFIMHISPKTNWAGRPTIWACLIASSHKECEKISCPDCVFEVSHITIGLDYLIDSKYITKAEALEFSLDNLSSNGGE